MDYSVVELPATFAILTILIATSAVFLFSDYISDRLPGTLWNMSGDSSSGEAEGIVSEVVIEKGDTLSTVLKKQNLSNSEIQNLVHLQEVVCSKQRYQKLQVQVDDRHD